MEVACMERLELQGQFNSHLLRGNGAPHLLALCFIWTDESIDGDSTLGKLTKVAPKAVRRDIPMSSLNILQESTEKVNGGEEAIPPHHIGWGLLAQLI